MDNMHHPLRTLVSAAVLSAISASYVYAGAFSLYTESSPLEVGNYAAGAAAEAADASTGWYNPAGLSLLKHQQLTVGGVGVLPSSQLSGASTFSVQHVTPYVQTFNKINGAENAFVPSAHYALPLGEKTTFGFSILAPYGLSTNWGESSPVRYAATLSKFTTVNFSPELGTQVSDHFAVGAGLDLQYAQVTFNQMIGVPAVLQALELFYPNLQPSDDDTLSYNKGHSFGVGFHVGVMGMFHDNHTRVGLNYQSQMRHRFNGYSKLSGPLASSGNLFADPVLPYAVRQNDNLYSNPIYLPDILTLSAYHDLNPKVALLGSVVYTGWSSFQKIQLNNVPVPNINGSGDVTSATVNASTIENYKDVWRVALGVNYHVNDLWMLRAGTGYDQTPTRNYYRDVRLPDADRWALSVGTHYQVKPCLGLDVGYTHLFAVGHPSIDTTTALNATTSYNVDASATVSADLVGAQLVWTIDKQKV